MALRAETTDVQTMTRSARVRDYGARNLTIRHLRAFVRQADIANFPDDLEVRFEKKLQSSSPYYDIEISASTSQRTEEPLD